MRQHVRRKHGDALNDDAIAAAVGIKHKASTPYPCPLPDCKCGYNSACAPLTPCSAPPRFQWRRDLMRHFRTKHPEATALFPDALARHHIRCPHPGCSAAFARRRALQQHCLSAHGDAQPTPHAPPAAHATTAASEDGDDEDAFAPSAEWDSAHVDVAARHASGPPLPPSPLRPPPALSSALCATHDALV